MESQDWYRRRSVYVTYRICTTSTSDTVLFYCDPVSFIIFVGSVVRAIRRRRVEKANFAAIQATVPPQTQFAHTFNPNYTPQSYTANTNPNYPTLPQHYTPAQPGQMYPQTYTTGQAYPVPAGQLHHTPPGPPSTGDEKSSVAQYEPPQVPPPTYSNV